MIHDPADEATGAAALPGSVGERLRTARVAAGLDLTDIAGRTRIPLRHLEAIEAGDFGALPSTTYATGFARAYARAVDIDEVQVANDVRQELAAIHDPRQYQPYETSDPARVPPRLLAWTGAVVALVIVAIFGWWYSQRDALPPETATGTIAAAPGDAATPGSSSGGAPSGSAPAAPLPPPTGEVVLTATQPVWLRITDAGGNRLLEKEMAAGERYVVPPSATEPTLRAGRPEGLEVSVGGRRVAQLGPAGRPVSGVVLTAAALGARPAATEMAVPGTSASPAP